MDEREDRPVSGFLMWPGSAVGRWAVALGAALLAGALVFYLSVGAGWLGWGGAASWLLQAGAVLASLAGAAAAITGTLAIVDGERSVFVFAAVLLGAVAFLFLGSQLAPP